MYHWVNLKMPLKENKKHGLSRPRTKNQNHHVVPLLPLNLSSSGAPAAGKALDSARLNRPHVEWKQCPSGSEDRCTFPEGKCSNTWRAPRHLPGESSLEPLLVMPCPCLFGKAPQIAGLLETTDSYFGGGLGILPFYWKRDRKKTSWGGSTYSYPDYRQWLKFIKPLLPAALTDIDPGFLLPASISVAFAALMPGVFLASQHSR